MKTIADAQQDMREAYCGGAPGVVSSATAWFLAAMVALLASPFAGVLTLIFGGMLIFPVSVLLCKIMGRSGKHSKNNPLAPLAIEGTIWMLISIPVAVAAAMFKIEWFFPAMLVVISGRYLTFCTLYGMRIYWLFGAALLLASASMIAIEAPVFLGAFAGSLVEFVFGAIIFFTRKTQQLNSSLKTDTASGLG
ncbi:MAG TPA: hypothetical protein VIC08_00075 [Cellvibrionaceae bacterium]